ncbi:SDR family NAD(P)-dependent oxidoreductase [Rubritalea profundi]|uniref:Oxidoreductase n=1 Tax=Rubritalea profundi TaxID=1658618 RepID=A0A2S7U2Y4_9BACT|nr:SDR family oxidoreductase [Rubritalea profundi]PQJ28712.1 oxidoreductase [Rubritalea profundi]
MARILLVGGNSGIGLSLGKQLISQGDELIQWSRSPGELVDKGAQYFPLDLTSELVLPIDGHLDGVVYLPGTIRLKPFHRITHDEFREDMEINAFGAARVLQLALPLLKKSHSASIVLFSSVAAAQGLAFHASIAMAKAAVEGLTLSLAAELAPKIRVNAISPSLTDTPLASNLLNTDAKRGASANRHPLKQVGTPEGIAKLANYLLSRDSNFISGQVFHADGGMSSLRT